jgi:hypothetical protein
VFCRCRAVRGGLFSRAFVRCFSVRLQGGITVRGRLLSVALIASFLAANVAVAATNPPGQHHTQKKKHSGHHGKKHSQQHSGAHKKNNSKLNNGQ